MYNFYKEGIKTVFFCDAEFQNSFYKSRIRLGFGYSITVLWVALKKALQLTRFRLALIRSYR